jgi:hypothetical protein
MFPRKREEGLIVRQLDDETLVYDLNRHRAFCLNRTAAIIWNRCDGQTSVRQLALLLGKELNSSIDQGVVEMALARLGRARLLQNGEAWSRVARMTDRARRDALRKIAKAGIAGSISLLLPVVRAVVAPTAAQATTGVTRQQCRDFPPGQCPNLPCTDRPGRRCLPSGGANRRCDCR